MFEDVCVCVCVPYIFISAHWRKTRGSFDFFSVCETTNENMCKFEDWFYNLLETTHTQCLVYGLSRYMFHFYLPVLLGSICRLMYDEIYIYAYERLEKDTSRSDLGFPNLGEYVRFAVSENKVCFGGAQ